MSTFIAAVAFLLYTVFCFFIAIQLVTAHNLHRERLNRIRMLEYLHSSWSSKPPISYL